MEPSSSPSPPLLISYPAILDVEHPELSSAGLFQLAFALDGYELRHDPARPGKRIKETLTVDVLEMTPQRTRIRLTPKRNLSHIELMAQIEELLSQVPRGVFDGKLKIARVAWELPSAGASSDERAAIRRIR